MKKLFRTTLLLLGLLLVVPRAEAGLFRNLLEKIGGAMEATNQAYWMGENSVGRTTLEALKGKKGNFYEAFDAIAGSVRTAQDQVLAAVKEVWKAVKDIILWLPRKLKAAFEGAVNKLASMNQGATVKERFDNLAGAAAPGPSFVEAPSAPGASLGLPPSGNAFDALLTDGDVLPSVDPQEVVARYQRASFDAPAAPGSETDRFQAFGEMMEMTGAIEDQGQQKEARKRIRKAYIVTLDSSLGQSRLSEAASLLKAGGPLYSGNPDGMAKAMGIISRRHPDHAGAIQRIVARHSNHAQLTD